MDSIKLTVIIPIFNNVKDIHKLINSLLKQSLSDWECIIIDDGSTDGSQEVVNDLIINDSRFQLLHRINFTPRKGANACRNLGLLKSSGNYIVFTGKRYEYLPVRHVRGQQYLWIVQNLRD
ncbi:glycosyltransferase family 2 protein [Sphingobacterium multivorum]|uniref:glycosyltransferase family 2 protein n=1 Tax=Sphingobacterium multivorum TaxID=28454 RepID=UPI003D2E650C